MIEETIQWFDPDEGELPGEPDVRVIFIDKANNRMHSGVFYRMITNRKNMFCEWWGTSVPANEVKCWAYAPKGIE